MHQGGAAANTRRRWLPTLQIGCSGGRLASANRFEILGAPSLAPDGETFLLASGCQRQEMAISLAREGHDRKACAALLSTGLCPDTPETVQALRGLHPTQPLPSARPVHDLPPEVVSNAMAKALRSFPADTAPGPSGLRVLHLCEVTAAGKADALYQHLASVVGLLAQGQACPAAAASSRCQSPRAAHAIAIGNTLRRLTAKRLMAHARELILGMPSMRFPAKLFWTWCKPISRPWWATWCYQHPSSLYFGGRTVIPSAAGVQQGDPLGPLLLAAAIQPL